MTLDDSSDVIITATPASVTDELVGTHTFYTKATIVSSNYGDSDIPPLVEPFTITVTL